jgi:tetratricopeptide (TPR) repeat protein
VKVIPRLGENVANHDEIRFAASPDEAYQADRGALLWYALGPRALPDVPARLAVRRDRYVLAVYYGGAPKVEIGFDGFLKTFPSPQSRAVRQVRRHQAYAHLREATRLLQVGFAAEAVPETDMAGKASEIAVDPYLAEWIARWKGKALVAAGRGREAEALFQRLTTNPDTGAEAAYDAGRAFHLAGELERALNWYRRGLGRGGSRGAGRGRYEYLEGAVFCLGELGRWEEALAEVERFDAAYLSSRSSAGYGEYVRWRTGGVPSPEKGQDTGNPDLGRYWALEFRWVRHEPAQALLAGVDEELKDTSEAGPFLLSLRGELLGRLGRGAEALGAEREALRQTRVSLDTSPAARAHYDLVAGRFAALARQAGQTREAKDALAKLKLWQRRQRQIKD